ncbi:kinase-like protein [Lentinus tigrinus ALCF2SS1-7]|uniref:Kinase-like protein n=1 Tax=Lentinus tigrinus ALCF2SS1-6 TaxID=1328759 RepID=A0A5C2SPL6_9APHY|nr:kinase-like protein [Lentinus tigrinus ALCF2SS1-6]RPD79148.1 kinase-like protein [Lentinus tigrinus ALCF2SS1-7]
MSTAAASLPDFMGCTIGEYYELDEVLGSGSFGVVYKAIDNRQSPDSPTRECAVKIIGKAGRAPKELGAIRREIALHCIVSGHSNILTIHDSFDDEEYFYIILDYCPGGNLFYHITGDVYMDNDELLRGAFVSLIDAVQYCHEHKIAHRDLKPENVLASEDGSEVFLADFGLATTKRMIDEHGSGTAIYMAPECHGNLYDYPPYDTRAADIWALGVILVNMITGRNPWEKASMRDEDFAQFIDDADYFYDTFPISKGACDILLDIFTMNPLQRISLRSLREAVMSTETFFRSQEEMDSPIESPIEIEKSGKSSIDVPDVLPGLSTPNSRWSNDDDDESPLVTPEGTTFSKPLGTEKLDWKIGSTARLLQARHHLEEQFGFA